MNKEDIFKIDVKDQAQVGNVLQVGEVKNLMLPENLSLEVLVSLISQSQNVPLPHAEELFDTFQEPKEIASLIFRITSGHQFAPDQIPYIKSRKGTENFQKEMYGALIESRGALLLQGRGGTGKSREVVELVTRLCKESGWTVCILKREEGDVHMNCPIAFPRNLPDSKIIYVIDDLHLRVGNKGHQIPYIDRLNAFLEFFDKKVDRMFVIATARSEPKYTKELNFNRDHPLWARFKRYNLPHFTLDGLQTLLMKLSKKMKIAIDGKEAKEMASNSDLTPRTVVENIFAAQPRKRLSLKEWRPVYRQTWEQRYREVYAKESSSEFILQALSLLKQSGLPKRLEYVDEISCNIAIHLGSELDSDTAVSAVYTLVDNGLVGNRDGLLDVFSSEQLKECLKAISKVPLKLDKNWGLFIDSVLKKIKNLPELSQDLKRFTFILIGSEKFKEAKSIAGEALNYFKDDAELYYSRGISHFYLQNYKQSESDFDAAIEKGKKDADVYFRRANARENLGDRKGAESDYSIAIELGIEDVVAYLGRSGVRFWQGLLDNNVDILSKAEDDLSKALKLGGFKKLFSSLDIYTKEKFKKYLKDYTSKKHPADVASYLSQGEEWMKNVSPDQMIEWIQNDAALFSFRGVMRLLQGNFIGTKKDCLKAISLGQKHALVYFVKGMAELFSGNIVASEKDLNKVVSYDLGIPAVYWYRGIVRAQKTNYSGAEKDFTLALESGLVDAVIYFHRGIARALQNNLANAESDFTEAIKNGLSDSMIFYQRGNARLRLDRNDDAIADYTAAIERDDNNIFAYHERGMLLLNKGDYVKAEGDLTSAIDKGHTRPDVYYQRGSARTWQGGKFHEAEADFSKALEQKEQFQAISKKDYVNAYYWRGRARYGEYGQGDYEGALKDFSMALQLGKDDADVYFYHGRSLWYLQKFLEAETDFTKAIEKGKEDIELFYWRGLARQAQSKYLLAEEDFDKFIDKSSAKDISKDLLATIHQQRGLVRYIKGDDIGAKSDLTKAIEYDKEKFDLYIIRSAANVHTGNMKEAYNDYKMARQISPDNPDLYSCLGYIFLAEGEYSKAIEQYKMDLDNKSTASFYFDLGLVYLLSGKTEEAKNSYNSGMSKAQYVNIIIAIRELEYWTKTKRHEVRSETSQSMIKAIKKNLNTKIKEVSDNKKNN